MRPISRSKLAMLSFRHRGMDLAVMARECLFKAGCLYAHSDDPVLWLDYEPAARDIDYVFSMAPSYDIDHRTGAYYAKFPADTKTYECICNESVMLYTGAHIYPVLPLKMYAGSAWGAYQFLFVDRLVWATWPLVLHLKKL